MSGCRQKPGDDAAQPADGGNGPCSPRNAGWAHFQHVADVGVRGFGASLEEAFEQAALALTAVVADLQSVHALQAVNISCHAPDLEILLADWLNELVFAMATRSMLFSRFQVGIVGVDGEYRLTGQAWGEPVDVGRHQPATEVKGATLSELEVRQEATGHWRAQCILDV